MDHFLSGAPSGAGTLHFVGRKGERFLVRYRRQKYNYAIGRIEAIDMTGHNYVMNIYQRPGLEIELAMTNNETGQRITRTLTLSDDEAAAYRALTTDEEQVKFGNENSRPSPTWCRRSRTRLED